MASSTIRKAIGAVKDQTSISLAKVAGNIAPDLEVLIVKSTSHDNEPADEKYVREILTMISHSREYVDACVLAISKRLSKTRDWIVAVKVLVLVHKLLNDGDPIFGEEMMYARRNGTRILNMSDFRDDAHTNSWDHSGFVKSFALFLDQKLEFMMYERKLSGDDEKMTRYVNGYGESRDEPPVREMGPKKVLERLNQLLGLLDRYLASRPIGAAKNTRMVLVALYSLVKDSFKLYADVIDALKYLLDGFLELEYADSVKAFDAYVNAAKMINELVRFYGWCKDIGVVRSSEFPEMQKVSDKLLGTLEGLLRGKGNRRTSPKETREEETFSENAQNMNEIKALPPPPENYYNPPTVQQPLQDRVQITQDLVNLKDDGVSADQQGNNLALALFSANTNDKWVQFGPKVTSAWQNPAAESGKADWELALVESASNLSKQEADLAGGFDSLLLNGMYDQGTVRQHVNNSQMSGGSASSVALRSNNKTNASPQVLALPALDGTVQQLDPFAASLLVPPPAYVQIADMERKQQLLTHEQQLWQQYASTGMQGQMGLAKIAGVPTNYEDATMPYGMQPPTGPGYYRFY